MNKKIALKFKHDINNYKEAKIIKKELETAIRRTCRMYNEALEYNLFSGTEDIIYDFDDKKGTLEGYIPFKATEEDMMKIDKAREIINKDQERFKFKE